MDQASGTGRVSFGENKSFNAVKVFSATMMQGRSSLGEVVTEWMQSNPDFDISEIIVTQSSDEAFHCLTLTVFYDAGDKVDEVLESGDAYLERP